MSFLEQKQWCFKSVITLGLEENHHAGDRDRTCTSTLLTSQFRHTRISRLNERPIFKGSPADAQNRFVPGSLFYGLILVAMG